MTTLRQALPGLYKGPSILALAALLCAALMVAGMPAMASTHGGGGGGGGHMGGGGGHMGGGGHAGAKGFSGGSAHPVGPGFRGPGFSGGHGFGRGPGFFRGPGFHGFFGGPGFFVGGYPWYGFGLGFGLGLGFAWDYPWAWGPGYYGYWGSPAWYPGYYGGGYYGSYNGPNDGYNVGGSDQQQGAPQQQQQQQQIAPRQPRQAMGALNIDISPADAEVYLNGEYIGHARDFGGWSRGYLWLEKGAYDIVFYHDGYKTLARQLTVYPGLVITWDDKMEHGQAVRPEDLPSKSHDRRDARLQYEHDRAEQIDRDNGVAYQGGYPPPPGSDASAQDNSGWSDNWHDRVNRDRQGNGNNAPAPQPQSYARPAPAPAPGTPVPAVSNTVQAVPNRAQYGRLHLQVEPQDASVYLDGRFVGTGSDVGGNESGLVLSPGHHKLAVVRPGRRAEERGFDAQLGQDVDLQITLSPAQ
jgi:hypothetical protein